MNVTLDQEEVRMGSGLFLVRYQDIIDPKAFRLKCPVCKTNRAAKVIFFIREVERIKRSDELEPVDLNEDFRARIERALRRHLVKEGEMVTQNLFCLYCTAYGT